MISTRTSMGTWPKLKTTGQNWSRKKGNKPGDLRLPQPERSMNSLSRSQMVISWICRITAAVILCQTLFFKFTGAPESIYIFTKVGMEPWGRYGSGVAELIASILLLTPRFAWAGALLGLGVISGAIVCHLTVLGIVVQNDGG